MLKKDQETRQSRVGIRGKLEEVLNDILDVDGVKDVTANETKVTTIRDRLKGQHQGCFDSIDQISMGTLCHLVSGNGSANTSTSSGGITVTVVKEKVGKSLDSCLGWYDGLCLTGTGQSISEALVLDDAAFKKNSDYTNLCENLKTNYACASTTDCNAHYDALIAMKPLDLAIFPESSFWDTLLSSFNDLKDKASNWFKDTFGSIEAPVSVKEGRSLLGSSTYVVSLTGATTGVDVVALGVDSGIDTPAPSSVGVLQVLVASFILFL